MRAWSAYLAWPDASAALDATLRSGAADERAHGYALLVDAARRSRDPHAVAGVIVRLGRLRNEQDPVRAAALTALANVAPLLTADTAAGLTRLTTDAVDARDSSAATTAALGALAADVLQHHVAVPALREWALLTIDLVSTGAHPPVLRRFDTVLRRGQETMVFERLRRIELLARGAVVRSAIRPANADRTALVASARWLAGRPGFAGPATACWSTSAGWRIWTRSPECAPSR
jgi:hypothetical protein